MRRRRALGAEVVLGLDQAAAEVRLPDPVDRDAGRQRVPRIDQPAGQVQPVRASLRRGFGAAAGRPGTPGRDRSPWRVKSPPSMDVRLAGLCALAHDHRRDELRRVSRAAPAIGLRCGLRRRRPGRGTAPISDAAAGPSSASRRRRRTRRLDLVRTASAVNRPCRGVSSQACSLRRELGVLGRRARRGSASIFASDLVAPGQLLGRGDLAARARRRC